MKTRRPWSHRGAALLVAILGLIAGPAIYQAAGFVRFSFQPHTVSSGWPIVAALLVPGLFWLASAIWLFTRLRGRTRWLFAIVTTLLALAPVVAMKLEKPKASRTIVLSPAEAEAWKNFRP
ncbi:hypothetical protein [Brevundimonas sp. FT23028]|uniref:hypothetical protein n=1 Tax=Brevundimonas sp. FT23028 TaxID=3393748 RepID=UPI003B588BFD